MTRPEAHYRTQIPGHVWPAIIDGVPAELLALAHQFGHIQWWDPARIRQAQFRQLRVLLTHAAAHVPYYRKRLRDAGFDPAVPLTEAVWSRLPILTRQEAMEHGRRMEASVVAPERGEFDPTYSGGSTGIPVRVQRDEAQIRLHDAYTLRAHAWHNDAPLAPIARFNTTPLGLTAEQAWEMEHGDGLDLPDYGRPVAWLQETGTVHLMHQSRPASDQVAFLRRVRPAIVNCRPSQLRLVLTHMREHGIALPGVHSVWTSAETVDPALRSLCREVLGCRIVADYTSSESGYLALQCPDHEHDHVCAESVLLEVLDEAGHPCPPGRAGRVVVTPLHAFAMPLLRYELGDVAETGPPCPCGRGLPVLARIVGRTRDALLLADGTSRFIGVGYELAKYPAVREYQLVQTEVGAIEVRLVAARPLTPEEEAGARKTMLSRVGPGVTMTFSYRETLPRTAAGKLRSFTSEIGTS